MESNLENNIEITDTVETGKNQNEKDNEMMEVDITNKLDPDNFKNRTKQEYRKIMVPINRMKPLKENWTTIVRALVVNYYIFYIIRNI
jgi:hypothetical protein